MVCSHRTTLMGRTSDLFDGPCDIGYSDGDRVAWCDEPLWLVHILSDVMPHRLAHVNHQNIVRQSQVVSVNMA